MAPVFYGLVALGTVGGILLSLITSNPIQLLVIVAVVNGIAAAPFLLRVILVSHDARIMGGYRKDGIATTMGWPAFTFMAARAATLLAQAFGR